MVAPSFFGSLTSVSVQLYKLGEKIPADIYRAHAAALIQPMYAIAVGIAPAAGRPIDRNADGLEKDTIGGARRHGGHQRHSGKIFCDQGFGRSDDARIKRRRNRHGTNGRHRRYLYVRIADRGDERGLSAFYRLTGKDAAIDIRRGSLRQGVVG